MNKSNGVFKLVETDLYSEGKKCFCIGADNCSDTTCPLVKKRLDFLEKEFEKENISINEKDQKHVESILEEFDVETEDELVDKINKDALTIPCLECRAEINLDDLNWADGEPYCNDHYEPLKDDEADYD